jgi:hypothetical protein
MNIFYLNESPSKCAQEHCDKHVVKMILEYAQLLSTAHRVLDGREYVDASSGRKMKRWLLPDPTMDKTLYKATHINHPSAVWARQSNNNYNWLYCMFISLMKEYTYRYGKTHACDKLASFLCHTPRNIPVGYFTPPPPAMPDKYKIPNDSIRSYHAYYINDKSRFAKWKNRTIPMWYSEGLNHANVSVS